MHSTRAVSILAGLLVASASSACAASPTRQFELVNRANDSISTFAIAAAGSNRFHERALASPLRGGGSSLALELAADQCLQDLRIGFSNGRSVIHRDVDLCRTRSLRIERLPAATTALPATLAMHARD